MAKLVWGPTTAGRLLTLSSDWRFQVDGDRFVLLGPLGPQAIDGHLAQLLAVTVAPGISWATCKFVVRFRGRPTEYSVDGIPNEKAEAMKEAIARETASAIANVVKPVASRLTRWKDSVRSHLVLHADRYADHKGIRAAITAAIPPPPLPTGIGHWDEILLHPVAQAIQATGPQDWPTWKVGIEADLARDVEQHNAAVFHRLKTRWVSGCEAAINWTRWVPRSHIKRYGRTVPPPVPPSLTDEVAITNEIAKMIYPIAERILRHNERFLGDQKIARKSFFDRVEKNPLTTEQVHAVVCMDDRVLIVAAAGSGKTSTMVAKTGYVLKEGLAQPEQVLLLAFNEDAAKELRERIGQRLADVSGHERVTAMTFHAFGLKVIAQATGRKPSLAPWVESGQDIDHVLAIIEALSKSDAAFQKQWNMFRTIYARDIARWGEPEKAEDYENGRLGFRTARGEIVRSTEERLICDWLFFHGVNYEYERAYPVDTATEHHRQYVPDFYYPDADLYHEHFALDAAGRAPAHFDNYIQGVLWKRELHKAHGTMLVETHSHQVSSGEAWSHLEKALTEHGIKLAFDPDRESTRPAIENKQFAWLFRVFQTHVKNNGLSESQLDLALAELAMTGNTPRLTLFLHLYKQIARTWEDQLQAGGFIDFEDMLVRSSAHVREGRFASPYRVILADEYQDSSRARIGMLHALAEQPAEATHLCCVGDDWQGIYRFAGSDITVMTEFEAAFGDATILPLNQTFRFPQVLCDISSAFVSKNSKQIAKNVASANHREIVPISCFAVMSEHSTSQCVEDHLTKLSEQLKAGKVEPASDGKLSVLLLGRYRKDRPARLEAWQASFRSTLDIEFMTVHASKGLEADYVFILNMIEGTMGFPSKIQDDAVLQMAMPSPESYEYAEERRLFYVAMTRAKRQVRIYTTHGRPSQFIVELVADQRLKIISVDGTAPEVCPRCTRGFVVERAGKYGAFYSCSTFPACDYKRNERQAKRQTARVLSRAGEKCECGAGLLVFRQGRHGRFLGCSTYPRCKRTVVLH